jgi:dipeptidyl aminopeptidase/acylaminoacyl peptidase
LATDDIEKLLNAGIQAAKAGNRIEARRLLEQVLDKDDNNEAAWMWYASVAETPRKRQICLETVLEINPNNQQARQALERLAASGISSSASQPRTEPVSAPRAEPPPAQPAPSRPPAARRPPGQADLRRRQPPINPTLFAAGIILAVGLIVVGLVVIPAMFAPPEPTPTPVLAAQALTATQRSLAATLETPLPTLVPNATFVTVVPTGMATFTPEPSNTPPPTVTPLPTLQLAGYVLGFVGEGRGQKQPGIYTINADGTGEKLLIGGDAPASALSWSSKGQIAYVTVDKGKEQIAVVSVTDTNHPNVLTQFSGAHVYTPAWSPDGSKLACVSDEPGNNEIYVVNADGSGSTRATDNKADDRDPAWSPDGSKLVYASDPTGKKVYQLFVLDLKTGKSTPITEGAGSNYSPAWSPDGKQIAFISTRDRFPNIYVMDVTVRSPQLLTIGAGSSTSRDPDWSSDGKYIVFASNRTGGVFNLFIMTPDGKQLKQVTDLKDNSYGAHFRPG